MRVLRGFALKRLYLRLLAPHPLPYTVVFGHTPQRQVLADLPYKIGIDTGCVYGGHLTCLEVHERRLYQVAYDDDRVRESGGSTRSRVRR